MDPKEEAGARKHILELVRRYYKEYIYKDKDFEPGDRIPYAGRVFDENELAALTDSALDFWLTAGRASDEFESNFARFMGVKYAHAVNSGSSANLLAVSALTAAELGDRRICPGDEVITVAASFPTTVAPIIQNRAVPVFVDITLPQYNIDTSALESAYSVRTKAVFLAHTLGNPFNVSEVRALCDRHDLWLIEDNCDALGSEYTLDGMTKLTGTFGHIGTASFYPPHHITMGEGGCVFTDDPLLSRLLISYRDWGRDCICPPGRDGVCGHRFDGEHGSLPAGYDHKYVYSHMGYNLKLTDMQAAIGIEQLKKLPGFIQKRRHNWERLRIGLTHLEDSLILPEREPASDPSWFGFLISIRPGSGIARNDLTAYLEARGIQTRLLFGGNVLRQPCFEGYAEGQDYRVCGSLTNTDFVMNNSFWIGVYPGMTDDMTDYVAEAISDYVSGANARGTY